MGPYYLDRVRALPVGSAINNHPPISTSSRHAVSAEEAKVVGLGGFQIPSRPLEILSGGHAFSSTVYSFPRTEDIGVCICVCPIPLATVWGGRWAASTRHRQEHQPESQPRFMQKVSIPSYWRPFAPPPLLPLRPNPAPPHRPEECSRNVQVSAHPPPYWASQPAFGFCGPECCRWYALPSHAASVCWCFLVI